MIVLRPPHAALNDTRSPIRVRMQHTFYVGPHESQRHVIDRIVHAADGSPGGELHDVVINCHGQPSYLQLGAGFFDVDGYLFEPWRGKVRKVWIIACLVARRFPGTSGYALPAAIARAAECFVVASTEVQGDQRRHLPYGQLDTYEGLVLCFGPTGRVTWSRRYPSRYVGWHGLTVYNAD